MDFANQPVYHERFGCGVVRRLTGQTIEVAFRDYGVRSFIYPDAFEKFLRAEDGAFAEAVGADLGRVRDERARRLIELATASESTPVPTPRQSTRASSKKDGKARSTGKGKT